MEICALNKHIFIFKEQLCVCSIRIFLFDTDQAQINSAAEGITTAKKNYGSLPVSSPNGFLCTSSVLSLSYFLYGGLVLLSL